MAEINGHDHEARISRLEAARKELEESFIVMAHLETKAAARVKEHAEFIASHEAAIRSNSSFSMKHEEAIQEIDAKLNALIDIVSRMQGGMESGPS